jgi:hypothetical protein
LKGAAAAIPGASLRSISKFAGMDVANSRVVDPSGRRLVMTVELVLSLGLLIGFVTTGLAAFRAWRQRMRGGAHS